MTTDDENTDLEALFFVEDSTIHGQGLFARKTLEKGYYLGTYDGPETLDNGMHVLWVMNEEEEWIGRDGRNLLRYLNHSREPNAEFDGFDLYAITDIEADEEVTIDYGDEFEEAE
jgi:SET domain-containing protein